MRTYKYKIYRHRRNQKLQYMTWASHTIWNYFLGVQKLRYSLGLPHLSFFDMIKELSDLRNNATDGWAVHDAWKTLPSEACEKVLERLDHAYKRFFKGIAKRPPKFRSVKKPYSFTLRRSGYGFDGDKVRILTNAKARPRENTYFKYHKHRAFIGNIKTVTIKQDSIGDFYMSIVTDEVASEATTKTGKAAGFDFGLKDKAFFTSSDGYIYESPEFYKTTMAALKKAQQTLSRKVKGSRNYERARLEVARLHRKIKRQRENHHWKLARYLVKRYDVLVFETLTFEGMKRLWGRKVSDYAPYAFHTKLQYIAQKLGKQVVYIDRFEPTSKVCSNCGQIQIKELFGLSVRSWKCGGCKTKHHRDVNAAINILKVGAPTFAEEDVSLATAGKPRRLQPKSIPHNYYDS